MAEEKDGAVISSLGLSGGACQLDLNPPCTPHPAFPLQPHARRQKWALHPTQPAIYPQKLGRSNRTKRYLQEGCPSPPHPLSQSHQLSGLAGVQKTRDGAQNTKEVLPLCSFDGRGGRWSDRRVKGSTHTHPDRFLPSPPLPSPPCSLRVCLFCLFKEFTEQEGRASSGGRTAARCRWCVGRRRTRRPPGR